MKDKLIILLLSTLSLLIYSCHNATEPPPVEEKSLLTGKIAFISTSSGKSVMYSINPDGTELKQINNTVYSGTLRWSPDGKQIAFVAPEPFSYYGAIYIMNADGSNVHLISTVPEKLARGFGPEWSPDGSKIAFTHNVIVDPISVDDNVIVDLSNGNTLEINNNSYIIRDIIPKWSPDGKKIIFSSNRDYYTETNYAKTELYIMDSNGKNSKRLTQYGAIEYYLWYPSDQSIIFSVHQNSRDVTTNGIGRVDTAGNLLWFNDMPGNIRFGKLSNDGKRLAFSSSTGIIQILDIQSKSIQKVIVNSVSDFRYYVVDWSIDDKELLVIATSKYSSSGYLEMVKISNGIVKRLLDNDKITSADWHK